MSDFIDPWAAVIEPNLTTAESAELEGYKRRWSEETTRWRMARMAMEAAGRDVARTQAALIVAVMARLQRQERAGE